MMQKDEERPVWMQALWSATSQNIPGTLPVEKEVDQDVVDSLMASELNALSMKEREKHMERLHCIVNDDFEETPEMIHEALVALHAELLMIPQKDAYNQAWHINRQYVEDPKFRLMFLRADRFNPKKAAERLVLFLTKKREFFGEASMVRSVTLNDLTTDDIDGLKAGFMQVLPVRDRAGRLVIIDMHLVGPKLYKSDMAALRGYLYHILSALEDEDTQKNGLINLMYYLGPLRMQEQRDPKYATELALSDRWLPFRSAGIHMCCFLSSNTLRMVFRALSILTVPEKRVVIRIHEGSHTEVQYRLMSFGIPTEALPISSDGEIKTNWQKKWMTARRKKEMNMELYGNNFGRIDFPTNKDVLLGKGRPIQKHPGNVYLRNLVHSHTASYFLADSKTAKSTFTWKIVDDIKNKGGRFLTKDKEDCWILALDNDARQKVGKLFMTSQAEYKRMAASTYPLGGNASDNNPRSSLIEQDAKRLRTCFDFYSS